MKWNFLKLTEFLGEKNQSNSQILVSRKRKKIQITNIRIEIKYISTDTTDIRIEK